MPEKKLPAQDVNDKFRDVSPYFDPYVNAQDEEERFLDGDRYVHNQDWHNRDRRMVQIRGQETMDTIQHILAQSTARPRSVEATPIDREEDPFWSEVAASLVSRELSNDWKMFEDQYEETIHSALAKRIGILWMDWDPDCGPYGDLLYTCEDARRYIWEPGHHPHHPKCNWLMRSHRIDCDIANAMYGVDWITPDREALSSSTGQLRPGVPLLSGGDRDLVRSYRDNKATIRECWYKNDKTPAAKRKKMPESFVEWTPDEWYLSCAQNCGYRSPTQGELKANDKLETALPERLDAGCPQCGGNLERIEGHEEEREVLAYSRGKRLCVVAPFSPAPDQEPLYNDVWPVPTARSFPLFIITAKIKPCRPMGGSITSGMWDQQLAWDQMRTLGIQRVFEHRKFWNVPRAGIYDKNGQRWEARDDQSNVMYRDATKAKFGSLDVHEYNGTGLDPSWSIVGGIIQNALTQYTGSTDLGLNQESSKNIAVGTIERLVQQGEVQTEHFNRRKNRELSRFYGVCWDYVRATYSAQRLQRLRIDGVDLLTALKGDDLPNFDFMIGDTKPFTGLEKARSETLNALMQIFPQAQQFGLPPLELAELFVEVNELPTSILRKLEKLIAQQQMPTIGPDGQPLPPPGMAPGIGPGMEPGMEPPGAGPEMGLNGAGMVPELGMA